MYVRTSSDTLGCESDMHAMYCFMFGGSEQPLIEMFYTAVSLAKIWAASPEQQTMGDAVNRCIW